MSHAATRQPRWRGEKCHQRCAELSTFYSCQNTAKIQLRVRVLAPYRVFYQIIYAIVGSDGCPTFDPLSVPPWMVEVGCPGETC